MLAAVIGHAGAGTVLEALALAARFCVLAASTCIMGSRSAAIRYGGAVSYNRAIARACAVMQWRTLIACVPEKRFV